MNTNTQTSVAALSVNTVKVDGEAMKKQAFDMAAMAGSATLNALEETEDTKDILRESVLTVLAGLNEDYGDKLAGFVRPDSETGNHPDKIKIRVKNGKGEWTERGTTWCTQFILGTPKGKADTLEVGYLTRLNDPKDSKTGIPDRFVSEWSGDGEEMTAKRLDRISYLEGRIKGRVRSFKNALKLYWLMSDISELPGVGCEMVQDEHTGKFAFNPIDLYRIAGTIAETGEVAKDNDKRKRLSVGNFLKINVSKAKEMDGGATWDNLMATLKREREEGGGDGATKPHHIESVPTFVARFNDIHEFVATMQDERTREKDGAFTKLLSAKGSDDLIESMFDLKAWLDEKCKLVANRYAKMQEAKAANAA